MTVCPRCGRLAKGWPLRRADVCSPKDWVDCIRDPYEIRREAEVFLVRKAS